jgi:hypothetical protein
MNAFVIYDEDASLGTGRLSHFGVLGLPLAMILRDAKKTPRPAQGPNGAYYRGLNACTLNENRLNEP